MKASPDGGCRRQNTIDLSIGRLQRFGGALQPGTDGCKVTDLTLGDTEGIEGPSLAGVGNRLPKGALPRVGACGDVLDRGPAPR